MTHVEVQNQSCPSVLDQEDNLQCVDQWNRHTVSKQASENYSSFDDLVVLMVFYLRAIRQLIYQFFMTIILKIDK